MVRVLTAILLLTLVFGCGKEDGITRAAVNGKVTLDGTPLENGSIAFIPTGGTKGPTAGGEVRNGQYSIPVAKGPVPGRYRVEIRASRKTGRLIPDHYAKPGEKKTVEQTAEALPKKYNSESTLEKEVKDGKNVLDFELTSR